MTDIYGPRIDIGQTFKTECGERVLIQLCPYAILMKKKFFCPWKERYNDLYTNPYRADSPIPQKCPVTNGICYTVQEVEAYNRQHGITSVKENFECKKEPKKMQKDLIKEAKRMGQEYIAVDDMVAVTVNYMGSGSKWDAIGRKNTFLARVECFTENGITFDLSKPFNSRQVTLTYSDISVISHAKGMDEC